MEQDRQSIETLSRQTLASYAALETPIAAPNPLIHASLSRTLNDLSAFHLARQVIGPRSGGRDPDAAPVRDPRLPIYPIPPELVMPEPDHGSPWAGAEAIPEPPPEVYPNVNVFGPPYARRARYVGSNTPFVGPGGPEASADRQSGRMRLVCVAVAAGAVTTCSAQLEFDFLRNDGVSPLGEGEPGWAIVSPSLSRELSWDVQSNDRHASIFVTAGLRVAGDPFASKVLVVPAPPLVALDHKTTLVSAAGQGEFHQALAGEYTLQGASAPQPFRIYPRYVYRATIWCAATCMVNGPEAAPGEMIGRLAQTTIDCALGFVVVKQS